jgi:hypothetical protein
LWIFPSTLYDFYNPEIILGVHWGVFGLSFGSSFGSGHCRVSHSRVEIFSSSRYRFGK